MSTLGLCELWNLIMGAEQNDTLNQRLKELEKVGEK